MLTLAALVRRPEYVLHALYTAAADDRVVDRAELVTPSDHPGRCAGTLLVCSPETIDTGRARAWLRRLAGQGAAGLILAADTPPPPFGQVPPPLYGQLIEAARHAALPLLVSGAPVAVWRHTLIPQITEHRRQATDRHAARLAHLLDHLDDHSPPAEHLLHWLARELDAEVGLLDDTLAPVPSSGRRLPAAGGAFTSTHPLGDGDRFLTARRQHTFSTSDRDLLTRSATVLAMRRRASVPAADTALAETLRAVRLAAFQALMVGHIEPAQRILGPLSPHLLDTDDAQIAIVDCAGTSRDETLARVEALLSDTGLAVRCPAFDGHIVVLAPHPDADRPEAAAVTTLRVFVDDPGRRLLSLGISPALPVEDIATGFGLAYDALATARISPTRTAVASRTPGLLDALDPATAQLWAGALLQPVLDQPGADRHLPILALGLEFEVSAASRILGIHRNTLSRRIRTTLQATGLACDRAADRLTLSLALQIHALHGPATGPAPHHTPALAHLLAQPPVTDWATAALAPLGRERTDRRTIGGDVLAQTLRSWAAEDFRVDATAQRLGLYPATVRGHIRAAEELLGWMLLSDLPAGPLHDTEDAPGKQSGLRSLAAAVQAAPGTPRPVLPDPTRTAGAGGGPARAVLLTAGGRGSSRPSEGCAPQRS